MSPQAAVVEFESDAESLHLSPELALLLEVTASAGNRVVVIGPEGATITFALVSLLRRFAGTWVTRSRDGYLSPATGQTVRKPGDALTARGRVPAFPRAEPAILITSSVLHRAVDETRLGASVDVIAAAVLGSAPAMWGPTEPLAGVWDRDAVTDYARELAPKNSRLCVSGPGLAALVEVSRSAAGVVEETRIIATGDTIDRSGVIAALTEIATRQKVLAGMAFQTFSTPDATIPPQLLPHPIPIAAVLGARIVRSLGESLNAVESVELIGSERLPSALVVFDGDGDASESEAMRAFLAAGAAVGPDMLASLTTPD